jgi:uncharacterized protein (TIGR02246 family)
MKMKAIFTLVAFAAACIANATYSNMFPKIAFAKSAQAQEQANEERVIREQNAAVEAAWNKHDAATLDQSFVEDCDFVNVFGEWISGRDKLVKTHAALFTGPFRESYKHFTVEKIRFVRPDVAIVHVRGRNTDHDGKLLEGDLGTIAVLVMVKDRGKWWIVTGQNTGVRPLPETFKPGGEPLAP